VTPHEFTRNECAAILVDALKFIPEPPGGWNLILAGFGCVAHSYVTNMATIGRETLGTKRCKHCGGLVDRTTIAIAKQKSV